MPNDPRIKFKKNIINSFLTIYYIYYIYKYNVI